VFGILGAFTKRTRTWRVITSGVGACVSDRLHTANTHLWIPLQSTVYWLLHTEWR